ncbi:hypothetical protein [Streptomyces catenulae]|uniref:Uncharacterized protein n=1 Tax=Streptomyces catenulae TaxID=66875 RepID=A0ABV2YWU7_9ACTN|nr:hypothetical protein [Streptomyces catenulae]
MGDQTPAEQALARSYTTGDGAIRFQVAQLTVDQRPDRNVTLTYHLIVKRKGHLDEAWEFTLPWSDKSFLDVLNSSNPDPARLQQFVHMVRSLLEEWWDTKSYNRKSAKMGNRLS